MNLSVYVGPYLFVEAPDSTHSFISENWDNLLRDAWMENNPGLGTSAWITHDCLNLLGRPCEFERTGNDDSETMIQPSQILAEITRMCSVINPVLRSIKQQNPNAIAIVKWGVLCCWS